MPAEPKKMTRAEQDNLVKIAKLNRDGALADIKRKTAEATADFEMQMAAEYSFDQREVWADLMRSAEERVGELDKLLADDCRRLGIPEAFRPSIQLGWRSRGENMFNHRRTELRRVTATRLVAIERDATEQIEAGYRKAMTRILSASLTSEEARALLAAMPTAEQLTPKLDFKAIKAALLAGPEKNILRGGMTALPYEAFDDC